MGYNYYDELIYETLLRIEIVLNSMFEFFEPWNAFFTTISERISSISASVSGQNGTFFPLIVTCLICLLFVSFVKWLVKL